MPAGLRPSIETSLHAFLPQPIVLHVHSVNAIAWCIRAEGAAALGDRLAGLNIQTRNLKARGLVVTHKWTGTGRLVIAIPHRRVALGGRAADKKNSVTRWLFDICSSAECGGGGLLRLRLCSGNANN